MPSSNINCKRAVVLVDYVSSDLLDHTKALHCEIFTWLLRNKAWFQFGGTSVLFSVIVPFLQFSVGWAPRPRCLAPYKLTIPLPPKGKVKVKFSLSIYHPDTPSPATIRYTQRPGHPKRSQQPWVTPRRLPSLYATHKISNSGIWSLKQLYPHRVSLYLPVQLNRRRQMRLVWRNIHPLSYGRNGASP